MKTTTELLTLVEFEDTHDCWIQDRSGGEKYVLLFNQESLSAVYNLVDYRVASTMAGPSVWLVPIDNP